MRLVIIRNEIHIGYRKDRYNLAKINYIPYLLHNSNPGASAIIAHTTFVPNFQSGETNVIGGEVEGLEILRPGNYKVERDINVRPGGKLILQSGVKLYFPPAVGMMVAGYLDARGKGPNEILLTLREEMMMESGNETMEENMAMVNAIEAVPVRLRGGKTDYEGRLQVNKKIVQLQQYVKKNRLVTPLTLIVFHWNYFPSRLEFLKLSS